MIQFFWLFLLNKLIFLFAAPFSGSDCFILFSVFFTIAVLLSYISHVCLTSVLKFIVSHKSWDLRLLLIDVTTRLWDGETSFLWKWDSKTQNARRNTLLCINSDDIKKFLYLSNHSTSLDWRWSNIIIMSWVCSRPGTGDLSQMSDKVIVFSAEIVINWFQTHILTLQHTVASIIRKQSKLN